MSKLIDEWRSGSVVGVRVDIDNRRTDYVHNNRWMGSESLPANTFSVRPVLSFVMELESCCRVKLLQRPKEYFDLVIQQSCG
jgi:hypothetical protein